MKDAIQLPPAFSASDEPIAFLARMKARASRNFRWTRGQALRDASLLACWCHVFRRDDEAMQVCAFLATFRFGGNYDLWTWIEGALALHSRLLRARGRHAEAGECVERILTAGFVGRRLHGVGLEGYVEGIRGAQERREKTTERDYRMLAARELCILVELGGSESLPVDVLERAFEKNLARLRELVGAMP
jgi:hypothetical protein